MIYGVVNVLPRCMIMVGGHGLVKVGNGHGTNHLHHLLNNQPHGVTVVNGSTGERQCPAFRLDRRGFIAPVSKDVVGTSTFLFFDIWIDPSIFS
jgi:hypothetical protein